MNEQKFFRCRLCGNMVGLIHDAGMPMICCSEVMQELIPNTTDGATEKHIPVVSVRERLVHAEVGSTAHPMTKEHFIEFIYLQTEHGGQMKRLCTDKDKKAEAMFAVLDDKPTAVYAYCNLHGLWKVEVCDKCLDKKTEKACDCEKTEACCSSEAEKPCDCEKTEACCSPEFSEGCK